MKTVYQKIILFIVIILNSFISYSQVYVSDLGDGEYQNPIIHADYSDPDAVRVGEDFYMVASSFNCIPGLPVLHSKDLVNWAIVNHIIPVLEPDSLFAKPQHGNGIWAPSIRYHDSWFYVYYGDPDLGIYMIKTKDPKSKWETPVLVKAAKGWIDPCPLWDEDGNAYLVHAFAGSRAAIKSILVLHKMTKDGEKLLDDGVLVFDGHGEHSTIEGPKMYKRNGYYYIFAPSGGVEFGWQTVLRSKNIYGPYEAKIVLHQGETDINGPHQGAWVELENGESWFIHFQDKRTYGRIVHLQPATWQNDWIVMGEDQDGDGNGTPVERWQKPDIGKTYPIEVPQTSDEFDVTALGLQWQWHGNPRPTWVFPTNMGFLRMNPVIVNEDARLWDLPNLLLQKFPGETFTTTTKLTFHHLNNSEEVGLVVMGLDYAYLSLKQENDDLIVRLVTCQDADKKGVEKELFRKPFEGQDAYLRVKVAGGGKCTFSFGTDGENFQEIRHDFTAREGKWIGAKVGLFSIRNEHINNGGYTDVDWFRIEE